MGNRILIVEDDRSFASQVKDIVDKHGHTALIAATGPEGVEMYTRHEPDLLVVDVMLPGMTGIQVIEKVRELQGGSDVPILLMSAMYRSADFFKEDIQRLRLLDFLAKPFSLIDFGRRIDSIFEAPEKGRAQVRTIGGKTETKPEEKNQSPQVASPQSTTAQSTGADETPAATTSPESRAAGRAPAAPVQTNTSVPRKSHPRTSPDQILSRSDGRPFESDSLTPDRYVQLISTLFHSHSSGRFDLLELGSVRSIYFLNGYAVWVDVPNILDGLPRYLAQESLLSLSQMARLAEIAESNGRDLRGALRQLHLIPDEELSPIFEAWISAELQKGLTHRGAARFERSEGFTEPVRIQEVNPIQALWQGVYRISDDDWFESELSELGDRSLGKTRAFSKLFGYLGRDHRLRGVAEALREPKTSEQFLTRMNEERGLGTRALWFMVYSGLVSFSDPHPEHAKKKSRTATRASKAKATATPPRPKRAPTPKPAAQRPEPVKQRAPDQSPPATSASPPPQPVSSRPAPASQDVPPPKLPEPEEKHVFFEPSRKKSKKPEPKDERSPAEIVRLDYLEKMDLNHYGFLEVEQDATNTEIEESYSRLAPAYRPRNLGPDAPDDEKQMARQLLARLVSAHEELSDPKRRARYDLSEASRKPGKRGDVTKSQETWDDEDSSTPDESLSQGTASANGPWYPGQHDPSQVRSRMDELDSEDAETLLQANREMQRGDFKHAFARLDELRSFDPSNSFVLADLGWCQFSMKPNDSRELEKALEWVDLALTFDPTHRNALEVKARILVSLEDPEVEVDATLRNLLKVVPGHAWAKRELQADQERKAEAQPKKKGGLRGLVGRKNKSGSNKKGKEEGLSDPE